jgi:hypothetical protein
VKPDSYDVIASERFDLGVACFRCFLGEEYTSEGRAWVSQFVLLFGGELMCADNYHGEESATLQFP